METFNLTSDEEKALVGILYNHLVFGTTMEVFNELSPEGIKRLNSMRAALGKLLKKYSLDDKLAPEAFLLLGMVEFLDKPLLEKWSADENNKHLQNRAKYFLKAQ